MYHNMAKRITSTAYRGMRAKQGRSKMLYLDPPCGNGLLVSSLVVLPRADLTWRMHQRWARTSVMLVDDPGSNDTANPPDQSVIKRR